MCVRRSGSATCTWSAGGKLLLEYQNDALTGEASGQLEDGSQYQGELIERVYPPGLKEGPPPGTRVTFISRVAGAPPGQRSLSFSESFS